MVGQIFLRIFNKYIPAEDSRLAAFIRQGLRLWKIGKIFLVIGGIVLIYQAALVVNSTYKTIPDVIITGFSKAITSFVPSFLDLFIASLTYLWQPILAYILIAFLTKSMFWRKFWCLVGVAGCILLFVAALDEFSWPVLKEFSWSAFKEYTRSALKRLDWREYQVLFLLSMQGYLFALWVLPREIWNVIGLLISLLLGLIVLISPLDFPTAFDDFGMFGAILAFFLGYLNALASLLQRGVRRL